MIWAAFSYEDWEAIAASIEALIEYSNCRCEDHKEEAQHLRGIIERIEEKLSDD